VVAKVAVGIEIWVLRRFHCDFSLTARQFGFSRLPQAI